MACQWCTTTTGAVQTRYALISRAVGISEDLQLETTSPSGASITTTDAQTQRHRSLGDHAQGRVATVFTTSALNAEM